MRHKAIGFHRRLFCGKEANMKRWLLIAALGIAVAVGSFLMGNSINEPPLSAMDIGIGLAGVALIGLGGLIFVIAMVAIIKILRNKPNDQQPITRIVAHSIKAQKNKDTIQRLRNAAKDARLGKDLDLAEDEFEVFHTIRNDGIAEGYRSAQHKQ